MNLLYALESVRTPFWDAVFSAVTHLGDAPFEPLSPMKSM